MSEYVFSKKEKVIQNIWLKNKIFKKSLDKNKNNSKFIFYDGPPFATGSPHYGHLLTGSVKDTICRHQQFNNKYVERRAGFDCHGLPIEYEIEKLLGIKTRQEILDYGIKNYNEKCRSIVMRCSDEWEKTLTRFGRWLDFDNGYKTMDLTYMESIWTVFKRMWDDDLIYKGFKVMPYSTACSTPLSNFEARSNYREITEESIIVEFVDLKSDWNYLVWTTTPWTLPSNMALCVNPNIIYGLVLYNNKKYILAKNTIKNIFKKKNYTIIKELIGCYLKDRKYQPILNYYKDSTEYRIICDNFVSDDSGTGLVHIAPSFGEDDYRVSIENNIISNNGKGLRCPVDENGRFTDPVTEFKDRNVKDCDKDIIKKLKNAQKLFTRMNTSHQYPFCWRSDTPLIYKAVSSWFVNIGSIKKELLYNNKCVNWVPEYVKEKRFHNWLENARDWGISRTRFWGTPIPIWTDGEEYMCIGSIDELEQLANLNEGYIKDLHRDTIDTIEIVSPKTGNKLRRIDEVLDCWFESGCMPFAHQHFTKNEDIDFPADFIAEGLDQTRGWFYTLLVISTAIKKKCCFKNVIVNGLVLANDGKKMSKRLKNYPNPMYIINNYGADSLRLYLINSPATKAEPLKFNEEGVRDISKNILIPIHNSYGFLEEQLHKYKLENDIGISKSLKLTNIFDIWILEKTNKLKYNLLKKFDDYILNNCSSLVIKYVDDLNNRYIKLNKDRFKGKLGKKEAEESLYTLLHCLFNFAILTSSILPHFSDYLYQNLKEFLDMNIESIHLLDYSYYINEDIDSSYNESDSIDIFNNLVDIVRSIRGKENISLKMPVNDILVCSSNPDLQKKMITINEMLINEMNTHSIDYDNIDDFSTMDISPNKSTIGKEFKSSSKLIYKQLNNLSKDYIISNLKNLELDNSTLNETHFNVNLKICEKSGYLYEYDNKYDNKYLVYVNSVITKDLKYEYYANKISTEVQKYRKELELKPWNKINILFNTESSIINHVLTKYKHFIENRLSNSIFIVDTLNITKVVNIDDMELEIEIYIL